MCWSPQDAAVALGAMHIDLWETTVQALESVDAERRPYYQAGENRGYYGEAQRRAYYQDVDPRSYYADAQNRRYIQTTDPRP